LFRFKLLTLPEKQPIGTNMAFCQPAEDLFAQNWRKKAKGVV
jgi:hypothetical protein